MKEWLPLIGVVLAQFVLVGLYFAKQRSDDTRRWNEKRLDAYRALSKAGRDASSIFAEAEEPEDLDDGRFVVAMNAADACGLDIDLLSTRDVRSKSDALRTVIEMCATFDPRAEGFPDAVMLIEARNDFENAVRRELNIEKRSRILIVADSRFGLLRKAVVAFFTGPEPDLDQMDALSRSVYEMIGASKSDKKPDQKTIGDEA